MNSLLKKLHFIRRKHMRVSRKKVKYFKELFLECLYENEDIIEKLNNNYVSISLCIFYKQSDHSIERTVQKALNDSTIKHTPNSTPGYAISRKEYGCICIFIFYLEQISSKRKDISDIRSYYKNGVFEEICHLVQHNGDSSANEISYLEFGSLYVEALGKTQFERYVLDMWKNLYQDRNHYEVYYMMMQKYPKEWLIRYSNYFFTSPNIYEKRYESWKRAVSLKLSLAMYISNYLRHIVIFYVVKQIPSSIISDEIIKIRFNKLLLSAQRDIERRRKIIRRDSPVAYEILKSMDENVFKTSEVYFSFLIDLWQKANLF